MNVLDRLLSIIAPYECVNCGAEGSVLCYECAEAKLSFLQSPICFMCGKLSKNFKTCATCSTKYTPSHVWIVAEYKGVAKAIVKKYKFEHARGAAQHIAGYMESALPYFAEQPVVVPTPTAPPHTRGRGFDHAMLLAKELARQRGWRYRALLARQINAQQQGVARAIRLTQLKGAFRVKNSSWAKGQHILLVDDITTTGATLNECAKMLKKAGAAQVDAVVFARTPPR